MPTRTCGASVPTTLALGLCLLACSGCALSARPVSRAGAPPGAPDACGPPAVRDFTGAITAVQAGARLSRHREATLAHESRPLVLTTASEAYRQAELRDYQRCLLLHRDGACHALVAYYELLWTFLATEPSADQMSLWQVDNQPPACAPAGPAR